MAWLSVVAVVVISVTIVYFDYQKLKNKTRGSHLGLWFLLGVAFSELITRFGWGVGSSIVGFVVMLVLLSVVTDILYRLLNPKPDS